jgi:3-isopropylmalate/(R)-2-methylmalate dehydratase small subunit
VRINALSLVPSRNRVALPCLIHCEGITGWIADGDEIEADFDNGVVTNLKSGQSEQYPAIPPEIKSIIEEGGMRGMLGAWLRDHPELGRALTESQH